MASDDCPLMESSSPLTSTHHVINGCQSPTENSRPLGAGAFGVVWAVASDANGQDVAVKKLANVLESTQSAKRVYNELKALTLLKHDNLLSAKGLVLSPNCEDFSDVYVLTELMETDLHRIIASGQKLTTQHVQLFIYQILRGLKYLHSIKIIHGDIKPGNMLVNADCNLKIGDFGLARSESCVETPSDSRDVHATLSYAAPELLLGVRCLYTAVDMWATGCLLAELLTRRVLFQAVNASQQLELMTELLGSPHGLEDFRDASESGKRYLRQKTSSRRTLNKPLLRTMLPTADRLVTHLLMRLLVFTPRQRISATQALAEAFVVPGQRLYHSTLCNCCSRQTVLSTRSSCSTKDRMQPNSDVTVSHLPVFHAVDSIEPACQVPVCLDRQLESVDDLKVKIHELCQQYGGTSHLASDFMPHQQFQTSDIDTK